MPLTLWVLPTFYTSFFKIMAKEKREFFFNVSGENVTCGDMSKVVDIM